MKLTLKNFIHHRDVELLFPEKGLVLISGNSGTGKTTIYKAIIYALYGNQCKKKLHSHDTNSCKVTLEIKNMIITRSTRPNHLLVSYKGEEYEELNAQNVIDEVFGVNLREFINSSYIVQRKYNSVLSMTPADQARFIEILAFDNEEHTECKIKFKDNVKFFKKLRDELEFDIKILDKNITDKESKIPEKPPTTEYTQIDINKEQNELKKNLLQNEENISKLQEEYKKAKDIEELSFSILENKKRLEIEVNNYSSMLSCLGEVKSSENINLLEKNLEKYKERLFYTNSNISYSKKLAKAEELKRDYFSSLEGNIKNLSSKLPNEKNKESLLKELDNKDLERKKYEKEKEIIQKQKLERDNALANIKKIYSEARKNYPKSSNIRNRNTLLNFFKKEESIVCKKIQELKENIEELNRKVTKKEFLNEIYKCPCCDNYLQLKDKELVKVEEVKDEETKVEEVKDEDCETKLVIEKTDVSTLEIKKSELKEWIDTLQESLKILDEKVIKHTVKYDYKKHLKDEKKMGEYKVIEEQITDIRKKIETQSLPSSISSIFEEVKIESKSFPQDFKIEESVEELEKRIKELSSELEKAWKTKSDHSSISREINIRKEKIKSINKRLAVPKHLEKKVKSKNSKDIYDQILKYQNQSISNSSKLAELQLLQESISNYERYQEKIDDLDKLKDQKQELENKYKESEKKLKAALGLEEAGREAEILSMKATIASINENARYYLEKMFSEPISVNLQAYKINSKGEYKNQCTTSVYYRGHETTFESFSGGESQRCELAFLLGVNDMLGCSLIILDECLNSLDSQINLEAIEDLKELANDKLILVTSHEAVEGTFDHIIHLE